jgi:hypothetical protein
MTALWVVVGYCALNVVIQIIIQPRVSGGAVGITATVAVLSLLLWAVVLGPLGAILAIPATLLLKTLFIDIDPRTRWVNTLIAANPNTSEEDPIRLTELLERAKRLRKLSTKITQREAMADGLTTSPEVGESAAEPVLDEADSTPEAADQSSPPAGPTSPEAAAVPRT